MNNTGILARVGRLERATGQPPCAADHVRVSVDGVRVAEACRRCGRPLDVLHVSLETVPDREP